MTGFIKRLFGKNKEKHKEKEKEAIIETDIHHYSPDYEARPSELSEEERTILALKGIVIGDIIGSKYEGVILNKPPFQIDLLGEGHTFTDDTVLTIATLEGTKMARERIPMEQYDAYEEVYRDYGRWYPDAGFGAHFKEWVMDESRGPYESCGNGSAVRAGIIGTMFDSIGDVIYYAKMSAMPTHNHPEGIKGAIVTAVCTWMAFHGGTKEDIYRYIRKMYSKKEYTDYKICGETTWEELIGLGDRMQTLSLLCQTSVPEAFLNLYHSVDYESCMRNTMRYLCDRDTLGAIAGGAAAGIYHDFTVEGEKTDDIIKKYLPKEMWRYFKLDPDYL